MARKANATKKKRNKRYTGEDAAVQTTTKVTKIVATKKGPLREFWDDKKTTLRIYGAIVVLVSLIGSLGYGVFALISWAL